MTDADRDVFLPVAAQPSLENFVRVGVDAERLGYDRVWIPETWGRDSVTALATLAARTDRIGIGSSILNVYSRSPTLIGQTAATLQEASDGRFRLGVGPSGPILVENWHGIDYGNPLRRTRETIEVIRAVLSGATVTYDGDYFDLSGFRLRHDPPEEPIAIDAAGMSPKSVELAGRFGNGWHALTLTIDGLRDRLDDFHRGAELGDRSPEDQRVTVTIPCCALENRDRARRLVREHIAFYVGAMGTFYRDALAEQGHGETVDEVTQKWQNGNQAAALDAIGDELLDDFAAAGTPEHSRERLAAFEDVEGVDAVSVSFPRGAKSADIEATMKELAPE